MFIEEVICILQMNATVLHTNEAFAHNTKLLNSQIQLTCQLYRSYKCFHCELHFDGNCDNAQKTINKVLTLTRQRDTTQVWS